MSIATVKMDPENLDDVKLIIRGDHPRIVFIKDRESALMLVSDLMNAYFTDHLGPLTVNIENVDYQFSESVWLTLYTEVDPWFGAYLDYCAQLPEVIPLFHQTFFPKSES
jgi:hypothetical protein